MTKTEWGIRYLDGTEDDPYYCVNPMFSEKSARMAIEHKVGYGRRPGATVVRREVTEWEEAS